MCVLLHPYQERPVTPLCNGTASLPSDSPSPATYGHAGAFRAPGSRFALPWQPDCKPLPGGHGIDNGWRGIHTDRHYLSRNAIVARIRLRVEPSLLPGPVLPEAGPVPARADSLGQAMLNGMRRLVASLPTLRLGPPGADASPGAGAVERPTADRVSYFIRRFGKAFDIRKTPALSGNADLGGVTVVIGVKGQVSESAARALTHLRREHGDHLLMEGLSQAHRWIGPTCDRLDANLRASCVPIEAGCAASTRHYKAMLAHHDAVFDACAFILGNLSVLRPDIKVATPSDISQCEEINVRYADLIAAVRPESVRNHVAHIAKAWVRFKTAELQNRAARQAHMLEQIRLPIQTGAARFVIMEADFLADLAPQLLSGENLIAMMPASMASSDARYRMPHPMHQQGHDEL